MKEMQSLSTKSPKPSPVGTAKNAEGRTQAGKGTQTRTGTVVGSGTLSESGTKIQSDTQVKSGAPVHKGKSYEKTRKSQSQKQPLSEETGNVDSLATAASRLDSLNSPVPQWESPTSSETPSLHTQTPTSRPPSTSAQLAESVAVLFKSATASTIPNPTPSVFHQGPHPQPLLPYPPFNYSGPHPTWMMQHYPPSHVPGPHQPYYMHNPG